MAKAKVIPFNNEFDCLPAPEPIKTILDIEDRYCNVDLIKHIDDNHIIKRMAIELSKVTAIKPSTIMLVGLGVFSSVLVRMMAIDRFGGALSSGLYIVAEQPPATAKTRIIETFQMPFMKMISQREKSLRDSLKNTSLEESEIENINTSLKKIAKFPFFISNTTPEGLESSLNRSNGGFACVSGEQGMFNSMIGGMYNDGRVNNNDVILYGYAGEHLHVERVGRQGFSGVPYGAIVLFAQDGSIDTLLNSSGSSGAAERFQKIVEKPRFGEHIERRAVNHDLLSEYNEICESLFMPFLNEEKYNNPDPLYFLPKFTFSKDSLAAINKLSNELDPHFADSGQYSHDSMRGYCGKADIHGRKFAAVLHAIGGGIYESEIAHKHVLSAIGIVTELMQSHSKLLSEKGVLGDKAAYQAIIKFLNGKKWTETDISSYCRKVQPFKSHNDGSKVGYVKKTIADMLEKGILIKELEINLQDSEKTRTLISVK